MDQYDSSKLKIDYLCSEILILTERLEEQQKINEEYKKLVNGRTDMKMLLSVMQSEQELLKHQISKLLNERNEAVSKVSIYVIKCLILEQILQVTQQEIKFISMESQQRIKYLQEQLQYYEIQISKQPQLYEFDPLNEGYVIKYKQIVNLNEATLKLQQEIENHKLQLAFTNSRLDRLQEQKSDLIQLNFTLSNEICRLKIQPSTGMKNIEKYIHQLVEAQRKLISHDHEGSDNDCLSSPMEDKIHQSSYKQTIFQEHPMPKLDLRRAQQIQAFTLQHMDMKQQKNQDLSSAEELQKWITEYKYLKTNYDAQRILQEQLKIQFEDIQRKFHETLAINATLIRANQNLEEKWQTVNKTYNQYKQFYLQYKDYSDAFNKSLSNKKLQETFSDRKDLCEYSFNELKLRNNNGRDVRRSSVNVVNITSVDSTANCINYRDKLIQMTKDVFQIFKKKQNENESSDEDIPQVNQMKRELKVSNNIPPKQKQNKK